MEPTQNHDIPGTKSGDFRAADSTGKEHLILIYHHLGMRVLYTEYGERLLYLGKGRYRYGNFPAVTLTSDDPNAP